MPCTASVASRPACERATERLRRSHPGLVVAGHDSSLFDLDADPLAAEAALRRARDLGARVVLACLPVAKQLMLYRFEDAYRPAVGIGAGSALAFYAGEVRRAPALRRDSKALGASGRSRSWSTSAPARDPSTAM